MPYTKRETRNYNHPSEGVFDAALKAVAGLEGKVAKQSPTERLLEVNFDKKILGKVLGDRTNLSATVSETQEGSQLTVEAYPVDAVGRKLLFGARKGVTQTVIDWFFAHVEHHLSK